MYANFQLSGINKTMSKTTYPRKKLLGGCWWFLTGYLENCVLFDSMDRHNLSFLSCLPIFISLAWKEVHQEHSHTKRILMVPDWSFGGLDHLWYQMLHHESTLSVILQFYADFQLHNMIKSASRIWSYLEDVDGSWLELLMI